MDDAASAGLGPGRRHPGLSVLIATIAVVLLVTFGADGHLPQGTPPARPDASPGTLATPWTLTGSSGDPPTAVAFATQPPIATQAPAGTPRPAGAAPTASAKPATKPAATPVPTPRPTSKPAPCRVFPSDNLWNTRIDDLPVAGNSDTLIAAIGLGASLHPDFSSLAWNGGKGYGIPINKVNLSTPRHDFAFDYADESDPGPYPVPANPKIEGGSDRHLILWDTEGCDLYEVFDAVKRTSGWTGGSGAIWNLRSNALRPNGWTSADAAGLPILPGLARYDEVAGGAIRHALRFTAPDTCSGHIYPARHDAGSGSCSVNPPMGLRVRLKADVDLSGFGPQARVILTALKRYGMLLADNGSPWYVTGAPSAGWNDDDLHDLQQLHGSDFEVVDTSSLR